MVTHSSILAWRIPWTEKPGRLQSMGSQRVRHDWATSPYFPNQLRPLYGSSTKSTLTPKAWITTSSTAVAIVFRFSLGYTYASSFNGHVLSTERLGNLIICKWNKGKSPEQHGIEDIYHFPYWEKNGCSSSAVMSSVQHPVNTFLLPKGSSGLFLEYGSLQSHCCPSITCCCDMTFTWVSYSVKWTKSNPFKRPVFRICIYLAVSGVISCGMWTFSCGMWDLLIIPWTGIEPRPSVLGVQSLSHWATKEVPEWPVLVSFLTWTLRTSPRVLKYSFRSCCFPWETQHYFWTTFLVVTADGASIFLLFLLW